SFRRGNTTERAFWKRTLAEGDIRDGDFENAFAIMKKHRALEDTIERARHYGAMAHDALALFPDSEMKSAMHATVEFCISRAH
ncbi:MAG: polyprenyl synthetase family protein, partial [Beijerinckiaceae bacterium]